MRRSCSAGKLGIATVCWTVWMMGCSGIDVSSLNESVGDVATGQMKVRITDDPFPHEFVEEAWVTITRIDVLRSSDEGEEEPPSADEEADEREGEQPEEAEESADESDADEESGDVEETEEGDSDGERPFLTVFESEEGVEYNLVELRNGRMADLVDAEIPVGSYKQMRVFVSGGYVVLTDGREFPLRVPSGDRSGIKLHFEFEVVEGEASDLLLDFDLSRAFVPIPGGAFAHAGEIRQFQFRPSHAMRVADLDKSGGLSGDLTDDEGNPHGGAVVRAFRGDEEVASSVTEDDGGYVFVGLPPGQYRLLFEGQGFDPHELRGQVVHARGRRDGGDDADESQSADEGDESETDDVDDEDVEEAEGGDSDK